MLDLLKQVSGCNAGCPVGNCNQSSYSVYADDLVIFAPLSAVLQPLLRMCSQCSKDYDIKFKSDFMTVISREDRLLLSPV